MSTFCSLMSRYTILIIFWVTWSLKKWYLIGMCLVFKCMTGFLEILMALVLSQLIVIGSLYFICRSSRVCFIQRNCVQQDVATMYYVFVVESDVDVCFLLDHSTKIFPNKNAPPLVIFLSSMLPTQSTSLYVIRLKSLSFGYHNPSSKVPLIYVNILFTYFKCFSLGVDWNLPTSPTACMMSVLVDVE